MTTTIRVDDEARRIERERQIEEYKAQRIERNRLHAEITKRARGVRPGDKTDIVAMRENATQAKKERVAEKRRMAAATKELKARHKHKLKTLTGIRLALYCQEHDVSLPKRKRNRARSAPKQK